MYRRPYDHIGAPQAASAVATWLQLRQHVMDMLCRAHTVQSSSHSTLLHQLHLSAASAIDICAIYSLDAKQACSSILRALLAEESFQGENASQSENASPDHRVQSSSSDGQCCMHAVVGILLSCSAVELGAAITAAGSHLEQLGSSLRLGRVRGGTAAADEIVRCMEDVSASLVATLTSAPQISRFLILNTDRSFLMAMSHWHDTLLPKVGNRLEDVEQESLAALAGSCAWLSCRVIDHGVLKEISSQRAILPAGISKAFISDELLPLLMDLKSVCRSPCIVQAMLCAMLCRLSCSAAHT